MDSDFPCLLLPPRCKVGVNPRGVPGAGTESVRIYSSQISKVDLRNPFIALCHLLAVLTCLSSPSQLHSGWHFSSQSWGGWWVVGGLVVGLKGPSTESQGAGGFFWLILPSALSSPCCVTSPMSLALSD